MCFTNFINTVESSILQIGATPWVLKLIYQHNLHKITWHMCIYLLRYVFTKDVPTREEHDANVPSEHPPTQAAGETVKL